MQHHRKGQDGAFWERLIDQSSTRLGRVCLLFFLSFLFLSQVNLEITQHVNLVRCRKPWKSQGWIPTAFPNLTILSQFRLVFCCSLCRYYLGYKALKQRIRYYCERVRSETPTEDECYEIVKTFSDLLDFQVQTPASLSLSPPQSSHKFWLQSS